MTHLQLLLTLVIAAIGIAAIMIVSYFLMNREDRAAVDRYVEGGGLFNEGEI